MIHRLLAMIGAVAYGVRRVASAVLGLVGLGALARFVVPLLVVVFTIAAVASARETARILDSRPDVTEATLTEVAEFDGEGSVWFAFDALIDDTSLPTPADLGTFFYLARDPEDPDRGLLVRSPLNDLFFRERTVTGVLVEDRELVASALEQFGGLPAGVDVDEARYLDEVDVAEASADAVAPSELGGLAAGAEGIVTGRVVAPSTYLGCAEASCNGDDARYLYLFADVNGGGSIVLRSPHPPDAVPVRLEGLHLRDTFDLAPVLESSWFAELDADVVTDRAFAADREPPITVPASWVPTVIFAILAGVLGVSLLVGYPIFATGPQPRAARVLATGEEVPVLVTGRLADGRSNVTLDRSPATVERLPVGEVAMLMWRYGLLRDASRREAEERFTREAGAAERLVVNERDQSALVLVARDGTASVSAGHVYRVGRSAAGVRFRQGGTSALLTTRSRDDRDRIASEIAAEIAAGDGRAESGVLGSAAST
jgi:hypothetical protein